MALISISQAEEEIMVKKICLYLLLLLLVFVALSCNRKSGELDTSSGSATLEWTAPTTNSDGSALTDLAGFKIYYGNSSGSYPQNIDVEKATTYQVTGLPRGVKYFFVVRAYNQSGVESDQSNEVRRMIY
jgi:hypothetical protein